MTRQELFDRYVADTLDEAATAELGKLLAADGEFAARFAKDLLATGLFVDVDGELQRVAEPPDKPAAKEHHPHLVAGPEAGDLPPSLHLRRSSPPPGPAKPVLVAGRVAPPPPPRVPSAVVLPVSPAAVPEHHGQPVLKSAQRGIPPAVIIVALILAAGVTVALVLGLNRKPPPPKADPVIARIDRTGPGLWLVRGTGGEKIGAGKDLLAGDRLEVRSGETRVAYVRERTYLHLAQGCDLTFEDHQSGKSLRLGAGRMTAEVGPQPVGRPVVIRTRHATIRVLGTKLILQAGPMHTEIEVVTGEVQVTRDADGSHIQLQAGSTTIVGSEGPLQAWEFFAGVNLNGEAVEIGGKTWLSYAEAMAQGLKVEALGGSVQGKRSLQQPLGHLPDPALGTVLMTGVTVKDGRLMIAWPLPNDRYEIFVWILEDQANQARSLRLNLEEKLVGEDLAKDQMLGQWTRFGPFPVTLEDGTLDFLLSANAKGAVRDPHLMGIAAYRLVGAGTP